MIMSQSTPPRNFLLAFLFWGSLVLTITVYIMRGVAVLSGLPGWILLVLIGVTLIIGILYGIDQTRRF